MAESANNPTKLGSEDARALRIIPKRGTLAIPDEKYTAHARTDVSLNHTLVSGHKNEKPDEPDKHRFVDAYTAVKDTTCPYVTTRFVTSTVSDSLSLKYSVAYGRTIPNG